MQKIINQLLTGPDNKTHDIGRWISVLLVLAAVFYQGVAIFKNGQVFSMQDFGIGCGSLTAGIGAMLRLKHPTEPTTSSESTNP